MINRLISAACRGRNAPCSRHHCITMHYGEQVCPDGLAPASVPMNEFAALRSVKPTPPIVLISNRLSSGVFSGSLDMALIALRSMKLVSPELLASPYTIE